MPFISNRVRVSLAILNDEYNYLYGARKEAKVTITDRAGVANRVTLTEAYALVRRGKEYEITL